MEVKINGKIYPKYYRYNYSKEFIKTIWRLEEITERGYKLEYVADQHLLHSYLYKGYFHPKKNDCTYNYSFLVKNFTPIKYPNE